MKIDATLYRQAYEQYRQWNEAELAERLRNAGKLTPEQAWRQYVALVEFCWKMCPQQSEWQRKQKLEILTEYQRLLAKVKVL